MGGLENVRCLRVSPQRGNIAGSCSHPMLALLPNGVHSAAEHLTSQVDAPPSESHGWEYKIDRATLERLWHSVSPR